MNFQVIVETLDVVVEAQIQSDFGQSANTVEEL